MAEPIHGFVGPNGGGKTCAAVELGVLPAWRKGIPVVSTCELYPEALGFTADYPLFIPATAPRDLVRLGRCPLAPAERCEPGECPHTITQGRGCVLFLDEITASLPSRGSGAVPAELQRMLNQLRKGDIQLLWTAPAWARAEIMLREVTQYVTLCRGMVPDRWQRASHPGARRTFPAKAKDEHGHPIRVDRTWRPNRLFSWVTYEAMSYEEFTLARTAKVRPRSRRTYWRSRHDAQHAYSTLEAVHLLEHLDDRGRCIDCGGNRKGHDCRCARDEGRPAPQAPEARPAHSREANRNGIRRLTEPAPR